MYTEPSRLTSVAPDSMSCGASGMFTQNFMSVTFLRAELDKFSFGRCFDGTVTIPDHFNLPDVRPRLPAPTGRGRTGAVMCKKPYHFIGRI